MRAVTDLQLYEQHHPVLAQQLVQLAQAVRQAEGGSTSNIHMDISRTVREIEEDMEVIGPINVEGTVGESVTGDTTYEDALATTVINKVNKPICYSVQLDFLLHI